MGINDNFFDSEEFKDLLNRYESSAATGDSVYFEPDEFTEIAEYYQAYGQTSKAVKVLDEALEIFPGAIEPLLLRSRIALLSENDFAKAYDYAEMIDDKSDPDYHYLQAEIMISAEEPEAADDYLEERFALADEDERDDFALDVADMYSDYGYFDYADKWLDKAVDKDSNDYLDTKGKILIVADKCKDAEKIYKELTDRDPFSTYYWNQLAVAQLFGGKAGDAIQSSEFAIAINPNDGDALINKAKGLFSINNMEGALEYYQRYERLHPLNCSTETIVGILLTDMKRYDEALKHLKNAVKLAGDDKFRLGEIYRQIAFTYSCLSNKDKALDALDKAIETKGMDESDANVAKGYVMLQHNDIKSALKYFSEAVVASHGRPYIYFRIAVAAFENDYLVMCYKLLSLMFTLVDDNWKDGYAYMAYCCLALEYADEYRRYLRLACEKNPQEVELVFDELLPEGVNPNDYYKYLTTKK